MKTNLSDEHVAEVFKAAVEAASLSMEEKEAIKLALKTMTALEPVPPSEGQPLVPPDTGRLTNSGV